MSGTPVATLIGSRQTIAAQNDSFYSPYHHQGFPAGCLLADGRIMAFIDSAVSHAGAKKTHAYRISSDGGATWGSPVALPWGNSYWGVGIPTRILHGANAGKIMVSLWGYPPEYASPNNDHRSYTFLSNTSDPADGWAPGSTAASFTDATLTQIGPHAYPRTTVESRVAEDTNGDLYICTSEGSYGVARGFAGAASSTQVFKMAAGTSTWVWVATAQLSTNTGGDYPPPQTFEEQYIIRLLNGDFLITSRQDENAATNVRYTHILRSSNTCATWTDEGRMNGTTLQSASRAPVVQMPSGRLFLHHRILQGTGSSAVSWQGSYYTSDDNGANWSAGRRLKDGAAESMTGSEDAYIYGITDVLDATTVGVIWADELSDGTNANTFWNTFNVPVPVGGTSLTLTPTAIWSQSGTTLTVTAAPRLARSPATASVVSTSGGLLRFVGTHADRFAASLDGVTYTSTVTVPAGTTTVYLGVTPQAGDTTLSAQVGIPV